MSYWATLKRIAITVFVINLVLTAFTAVIFVYQSSRSGRSAHRRPYPSKAFLDASGHHHGYDDFFRQFLSGNASHSKEQIVSENEQHQQHPHRVVEIWSKAAIGYYLWEHILEGSIDKNIQDGMYVYGSKTIGNIKFKFRSGPTLTIDSLRRFALEPRKSRKSSKEDSSSHPNSFDEKNLILVLNGRDIEKVEVASSWLQEVTLLAASFSHQLSEEASNHGHHFSTMSFNVGIILLGSESCFNSWILPFLSSSGGPIKFLFITYDWKMVDNSEIFQWPLGVATYRNFPPSHDEPVEQLVNRHRPYACNFLGTVYSNSSREEVISTISLINEVYSREESSPPCFLRGRKKWAPSETKESLGVYIEAIKSSDLTLNPIGMNHECYRIYEAMQFGSTPVLEENLSHVQGKKTSCDHSSVYRLLKEFKAPAVYVSNWTTELTSLIHREVHGVSREEKVERRKRVIDWYSHFRREMRDRLVKVIKEKFFREAN